MSKFSNKFLTVSLLSGGALTLASCGTLGNLMPTEGDFVRLGVNSTARAACSVIPGEENTRDARSWCKNAARYYVGETAEAMGFDTSATSRISGTIGTDWEEDQYTRYQTWEANDYTARSDSDYRRPLRFSDDPVIVEDLTRCPSAGQELYNNMYGIQTPHYCYKYCLGN